MTWVVKNVNGDYYVQSNDSWTNVRKHATRYELRWQALSRLSFLEYDRTDGGRLAKLIKTPKPAKPKSKRRTCWVIKDVDGGYYSVDRGLFFNDRRMATRFSSVTEACKEYLRHYFITSRIVKLTYRE